jgi:hypothetical protein|tara:strand:+ start:3702 stop:3905 length:204 start_codon:yes stop_codon:yes gene_type:complete
MKKIQSKWAFILILFPLGSFIYLIDKKLGEGFLEGAKPSDHFFIIGLLIIAVSILLAVILNIDRDSK